MNFDVSPTMRLERIPLVGRLIRRNPQPFPPNVRYGDIVRGLPLEKGSCSCIYCSHVLEHLSLEDFRTALGNTHVLLKENGIFRFVVPDLRILATRFVNDESSASALRFMQVTGLGQEKRERGLQGFVVEWLGNTRHRWMWDYPSIATELEKAGFRNIRRAYFNDSNDPMFLKVEEKERWEDCLGVECVK